MIRYFIRLIAKILSPILFEWENNIRPNTSRKSITIDDSSRLSKSSRIINTALKKESIIIGKDTWVQGELMVFPKGKITIGDNCFIGELVKIAAAKSIEIGNNVLIAHGVNILDNNSHPIDFIERREDYKKIFSKGFDEKYSLNEKSIIIEDDVWVGFNVTILKGVKIGRGAIIAAESLILKDVPEFTIVGGNPAQFIKNITDEEKK